MSIGQNGSLQIGKRSSLTLHPIEGWHSKYIKNSRSYNLTNQITQFKKMMYRAKQRILNRGILNSWEHFKCLTFLVIEEMEIKTTLRFHLTPIRMATIKSKKQTNKKKKNPKTQRRAHAGKDVEKGEHSSIADGIANLQNHSGNQSGSFSENWK